MRAILDALTANPDVWASTVFLLTFDENDGLFDHLPPAAPPSWNRDGTLAGAATFDLAGEYFDDHEAKYIAPEDHVTGTTRPWGLGPRVPMYVASPWSKGGWVNSETFDHTSLGRFLEKRFGITVPAISPWHRAICGDLTSCFDFSLEGDGAFPPLPDTTGSKQSLARHLERAAVLPPRVPDRLFQEQGIRRSRPLPYILHVDAASGAEQGSILLRFINEGTAGTVFHVYDLRHLDRIPRRYSVESGKALTDVWTSGDELAVDLLVLGPNGFRRSLTLSCEARVPELVARYDSSRKAVLLTIDNTGSDRAEFRIGEDRYGMNEPRYLRVAPGESAHTRWLAADSQNWYDFTVSADGCSVRLAGRIEDGKPGISDPLMFV